MIYTHSMYIRTGEKGMGNSRSVRVTQWSPEFRGLHWHPLPIHSKTVFFSRWCVCGERERKNLKTTNRCYLTVNPTSHGGDCQRHWGPQNIPPRWSKGTFWAKNTNNIYVGDGWLFSPDGSQFAHLFSRGREEGDKLFLIWKEEEIILIWPVFLDACLQVVSH